MPQTEEWLFTWYAGDEGIAEESARRNTIEQVQIAHRDRTLLAAPLQGPITMDLVASSKDDDIDGVASILERALANVPDSMEGWERLDASKSPFQRALGIRKIGDFERGLRLLLLNREHGAYVLQRFIPYPGEWRGFAFDDAWERRFRAPTPVHEIAETIVKAVRDPNWPTR